MAKKTQFNKAGEPKLAAGAGRAKRNKGGEAQKNAKDRQKIKR